MNEKTDYFLVYLSGTHGSTGVNRNDYHPWMCRTCRLPRPDVTSIDFQIDSRSPELPYMDADIYMEVAFARRDFLERMGQDVIREYLYLGELRNCDGDLLEDWVTFRGKNRILLRGRKRVHKGKTVTGYRCCDTCGAIMYHGEAPHYLCPAPPAGVRILEGGAGTLVVTRDLFEKLSPKKSRDLDFYQLPVLEEPLDDLPVELKCPKPD
ncbi:hypothetical protein [Rhodophyticola porphyridii]|nr:hypothetical protein [Rhodophyticola porphyridii]